MNKIILIGNLTRDPESGVTANGVGYTRFTLAVNRTYPDANGNREADFINITTWRKTAEACGKHLFKGSKVGVSGSLQQRRYEDRDGIKRTAFDVVADEVEFLSPKTDGKQTDAASDLQEVNGDDLPF